MNESNTFHIVCSTDDNYAAYCAVMLASLCENNKDHSLHIYVFNSGLSPSRQSLIAQIGDKYQANIHFCVVDDKLLAKCPLQENYRLTIAAYYRFLVADLLPDTVDRVLYLDVDIIVNGSILPLWNTDLGESVIGAVPEDWQLTDEAYERLNIPAGNSYFNSGMMLIDLKKWRAQHISEQLFQCVAESACNFLYHDQDVFNLVLNDKWKKLDPRWNWLTTFMYSQSVFASFPESVLNNEFSSAVIIHYSASKPWNSIYSQPLTHLFHKYLRLSGVPVSLKNDSSLFKLRRAVYGLLVSVGARKRIYKAAYGTKY